MGIAVRIATTADAEHIARLMGVLGYPTSADRMRKRLESIAYDDDYATLVAAEGHQVVGFVGTRIGVMYESDGFYGQILALAVARDHQRRGIGRMLMHAAESLLIARGTTVLIVTSGNHRSDAHAFYEQNGYAFTGRRYKKYVESPA